MVSEVAVKAGDKNKDVQTAASDALLAIASAITPTAVKAILPKLIDNLTNTNKWTEKVAILRAVSQLVDTAKSSNCFENA